MFVRSVMRVGAVARRSLATEAAAATEMKLNFVTPHSTLYSAKTVDKVILPGAQGEYGVTVGHSPIISQLQPGMVSVVHTGGEIEKFFVAGGFSMTNAESVTDVSVTEAVPVDDLDEASIKSGHAEAIKAVGSGADGSVEKATAQIEVNTYTAMARAAGITL